MISCRLDVSGACIVRRSCSLAMRMLMLCLPAPIYIRRYCGGCADVHLCGLLRCEQHWDIFGWQGECDTC